MAGEEKTNTNEEFIKDGKKINRQKCQIFTRVMGYLRPVSNYNIGKKSEFYSRVYFKDMPTANKSFIDRYSLQST